jgi:NitT/TauT family transport system ATP-binding protein
MSMVQAPPKDYISVQNLKVAYDNGREALGGLSLEVGETEFVAVLGPSGCGKSTLLQVLSGLLAPSAGSAAIAGHDVTRVAGERLRVGYVFQDHRLLPWRSVRQNLEIVLAAAGVPRAEWADRITKYLTMLQVEPYVDSWPMQLSGGQRQRVSIARALAIEPAVMLMDEPFSTLDEVTARVMRQQISELWMARPGAVIFVTHSIREAVFLADRIIILTRGPATLLEEVVVPIGRPRRYEDPALTAVEAEIVGRVMAVWGDDQRPAGTP